MGLTLEEIVTALAVLPVDHAPTRRDWQRLTAGWQDRIAQRISLLEALQGGLSNCIGCGCLSLRTCALANPDDVAAEIGTRPPVPHERLIQARQCPSSTPMLSW